MGMGQNFATRGAQVSILVSFSISFWGYPIFDHHIQMAHVSSGFFFRSSKPASTCWAGASSAAGPADLRRGGVGAGAARATRGWRSLVGFFFLFSRSGPLKPTRKHMTPVFSSSPPLRGFCEGFDI